MERNATAEEVKELRRSLRLSQQELGGRLFVTAMTISRWENGQSPTPVPLWELKRRAGCAVVCVKDGVVNITLRELLRRAAKVGVTTEQLNGLLIDEEGSETDAG